MSHNLRNKKNEEGKSRKESKRYSCVSAYQSKPGRLSLAASLDCCTELFLSCLSEPLYASGSWQWCPLPSVLLAARAGSHVSEGSRQKFGRMVAASEGRREYLGAWQDQLPPLQPMAVRPPLSSFPPQASG